MSRFYPGLNVRVTLPFLIAIVFVAGIGVFIATRLVSGSIQERMNNQLVDSARSASNTVVDIERQLLATLRLMAFTTGLPEALASTDTTQLDTLLHPIAINNGVDSLFVFDRNGRSFYELDRQPDGYTVVDPPEDIHDREGVQRIVTSAVDRLGDKWVDVVWKGDRVYFFVNAPLVIDNVVVGGISVGIGSDVFTQRISQQALSAILLYNDQGRVMGTTFPSRADQNMDLSPERAAELMGIVHDRTIIEDVAVGAVTYKVLYGPLELRGRYIGLIAVGLPSDFIADQIGTSRDSFIVLFTGLFVGIAIMGILVSRSIIDPVSRLLDTTRAIRAGDLSRRVELEIPDELGELGDSFDHMTNELVARNKEISDLYIAQLQETARRDAVLAGISDAVIVFNMQGRLILRNSAADRLIEKIKECKDAYSEFTKLCRHPKELSHPRTVTLIEDHFSVLATPVHTPSQEMLGYVIVFRDVTPMVQAERLKDEMILQLSHELRTPLSAARGYVDLLSMFNQDKFDAHSIGFFDNTVVQLDTLERMVNQVVDVSAILANKFEIDFKSVELTALVYDVIGKLKPLQDRQQMRLSLLLPEHRIWIDGDGTRLSQALEQVVRNAYSYTLASGWVEITVEFYQPRVVISIVDNGVGIEADEIPKVFDRMYRGKSADAGPTDTRGLGLGLYLAREIIEAHRGTITIESELNVGTIVTITLPAHHSLEQ